eukprot:363419-Chlamydomonas_euryale.AAC.4
MTRRDAFHCSFIGLNRPAAADPTWLRPATMKSRSVPKKYAVHNLHLRAFSRLPEKRRPFRVAVPGSMAIARESPLRTLISVARRSPGPLPKASSRPNELLGSQWKHWIGVA